MASILKVDTITGVATAGSISVTGEGNSTTTNLQQGLVKVWLYAQQRTATVEAKDSFNVSSWSDDATGQSLTNFTNVMANTTYSVMVNHNYASATKTGCNDGLPISSSQLKQKDYDYTGTSYDHDYVYNNVHGDLA